MGLLKMLRRDSEPRIVRAELMYMTGTSLLPTGIVDVVETKTTGDDKRYTIKKKKEKITGTPQIVASVVFPQEGDSAILTDRLGYFPSYRTELPVRKEIEGDYCIPVGGSHVLGYATSQAVEGFYIGLDQWKLQTQEDAGVSIDLVIGPELPGRPTTRKAA